MVTCVRVQVSHLTFSSTGSPWLARYELNPPQLPDHIARPLSRTLTSPKELIPAPDRDIYFQNCFRNHCIRHTSKHSRFVTTLVWTWISRYVSGHETRVNFKTVLSILINCKAQYNLPRCTPHSIYHRRSIQLRCELLKR